MLYYFISVGTIPGKRFQGIEHLKKGAAMMSEKYGVRVQVLGNGSGPVYQNHLVTRYESMSQMEEVNTVFPTDPDFQTWFQAGEGLIKWEEATQHYFLVHE